MKLLMFSTREDERESAARWAEKMNVELTMREYELSMETIDEVTGYDGISTSQTGKFDDRLYAALKERGIKQIAQRSAGYDMIDLDEASANDLIVSNVPSYSPNAIAEYAVFAALNIIRNTNVIQSNLKQQNYTWNKKILSREIRSMTVAIIGTGRIGRIAAQIFKGFGADVIGYDIYPSDEAPVRYVDSLEEAVSQADVISIHMPATKDNYHMFNDQLFSTMKQGVYIVNTARGVIVDTAALIRALDKGIVAAAALDTYENEAPYFPKDFRGKEIDDTILLELMERDDVLLSPHIAFYTDTAVMNLVEGGLNSAYQVLTTGTCDNRVN